MFKNRKLAKRLQKIGVQVDETFMVYINNDDGKSFNSYADTLTYIKEYRECNAIFKLQIFRIETYSL